MRLLLVNDAGEQLEARCDQCKYWHHGRCASLVVAAGYDNVEQSTDADFGCKFFEEKRK